MQNSIRVLLQGGSALEAIMPGAGGAAPAEEDDDDDDDDDDDEDPPAFGRLAR